MYEKHNWVNGEVITEDKLNHIEDGIASNGIMVVTFTKNGDTITADKTYQSIIEAEGNKTIYGILDAGLVKEKFLYAGNGAFFRHVLQEGGRTFSAESIAIGDDEYVEYAGGTCSMTPFDEN